MKFSTAIFQTNDSRVAFMPWGLIKPHVKNDFASVKYEKVYDGPIVVDENALQNNKTETLLDYLFCLFNVGSCNKDNQPTFSNFSGHSLSVSDIVWLNGHYYYCDFLGWKQMDVKGWNPIDC